MSTTTLASLPRRALIVLTSHDQVGDTGKATGAYLAEITHAYWPLVAAGIEVDFASPKGGRIPLDGVNREDADNARFLDDAAVMARLHASFRPDQIDATRYAAIYFAGGHGTMWDLPNDVGLAKLAATIYQRGGIVAAVCHGPAGLVNIQLDDGQYLVAGKQVAAFTDDEERAVKLDQIVPFLLASTLTARGAKHVAAPNFQKQVVVDQRLITGQNPASARGVGEELAKALAEQPRKATSLVTGTLSSLLLSTLIACVPSVNESPNLGLEGGKGDFANDRITLAGFEQPEAVEWDSVDGVWYVSNFGGAPVMDGIDHDGDGFIAKVSANGRDIEMQWLTGLDAPKGMRLVGRTLFVADIDKVLAIDVESAAVTRTFAVPGSVFLNDIDAAADGSLYVTDTLGNTIFRIDAEGNATTVASGEHLMNPNGIRVADANDVAQTAGTRLVIAAWGPITDPATFATSRPGDLYTLDLATGAQDVIASQLGNLDGLILSEHGYTVTSWAGTVLDIDRDGRVAERASGFKSGADVAVARGRIAVPELLEGKLTLIAE